MKTPEERNAYAKGYYAGCRNRWPAHRPPTPPNGLVAGLVDAAMNLRDAVDSYLAVSDEEDELQKTLGNPMDEVTDAISRIGDWLRSSTAAKAGGGGMRIELLLYQRVFLCLSLWPVLGFDGWVCVNPLNPCVVLFAAEA